MIRFIDLRGMETYKEFAFWDTIRDSFVSFQGSQAWSSKAEFAYDFVNTELGTIHRFLSLMPNWVSETEAANSIKLDTVDNWG